MQKTIMTKAPKESRTIRGSTHRVPRNALCPCGQRKVIRYPSGDIIYEKDVVEGRLVVTDRPVTVPVKAKDCCQGGSPKEQWTVEVSP